MIPRGASDNPVQCRGSETAAHRSAEKLAESGETILLVDGGRTVAKLIPAGQDEQAGHLANVQGWLEDDDPFFSAIDEIVEARRQHLPRIV